MQKLLLQFLRKRDRHLRQELGNGEQKYKNHTQVKIYDSRKDDKWKPIQASEDTLAIQKR